MFLCPYEENLGDKTMLSYALNLIWEIVLVKQSFENVRLIYYFSIQFKYQ